MCKKVLQYFSNNIALQYYNAFIKLFFFTVLYFGLMIKDQGNTKLIDKINCLTFLLVISVGFPVHLNIEK